MKTLIYLLVTICLYPNLFAQDTLQKTTVVLPIISNGIDLASVQTAESILRMELGNEKNIGLVSEKKTFTANETRITKNFIVSLFFCTKISKIIDNNTKN